MHYGKKSLGNKHCLHKCDNRRCVRPLHLFKGTNIDNVNDKVRKGRQHHLVNVAGESNGSAKLTNAQVRKIRKLWLTGNVYQKELAKKFGVVQQLISLIVTGKKWVTVA